MWYINGKNGDMARKLKVKMAEIYKNGVNFAEMAKILKH